MRDARAWVLGLAVASAAVTVQAVTIRVPQDYSTIQQALNVAGVGDTVLVGPGTYSDYSIANDSAVVGRMPDGVVLKSEEGPSETVIDLAPLEGAAFSAGAFTANGHTSGQTIIEGFRVTSYPPVSWGVGVAFSDGVQVRNCVFEVPEPLPGATQLGIRGQQADGLRVTDCSFLGCRDEYGGAGIGVTVGNVVVERCVFVECGTGSALESANGGSSFPPGSLEVRDSVFQRCVTTNGGGGIRTDQRGGVLIERCTFEEMDAIGTAAPAIELSGLGLRTVSNCVFRNMDTAAGGGACIAIASGGAVLSGNTFADLHQEPLPYPVVLITQSVGSIVFENNIVAHTSGGVAISGGTAFTNSCNVFWDNVDGIGLELDATDRIADPQFCDPDNGDYALEAMSPCLPPYSLGCDLIGALGQGCGSVSVKPESWGKIKSVFRNEEEVKP